MPRVNITNTFSRAIKCPRGKKKEVYYDLEDTGFLLEVRATGTKTFYYKYSSDGKSKQTKLSDTTTITADKARTLVQKLKKNQDINRCISIKPTAKPSTVITIGDFYEHHYLPYIKTSKRSYKKDISYFTYHILPVWKDTPMDQLSHVEISQMHISLVHDKKLNPNTANKLINYLSFFYNTAINWETIGVEINPTSRIKLLQIDDQINRYLNKEETTRLMEAVSLSSNIYFKPFIQFLLLTGARREEVVTAKWKYIDLESKIWTIPITKSAKVRYIPITTKLEEVLLNINRTKSPYLFPSTRDHRKPFSAYQHHWYKAKEAAQLNDLRIHDLRHTFASTLVNSGRSLYEE